jgi:hypothetical protein
MNDNVNHPKHYTSGNIECIDAITESIKDLTGIEAHCTACALKYLWRWKKKNGHEDLKKAIWYINRILNDKHDSNDKGTNGTESETRGRT